MENVKKYLIINLGLKSLRMIIFDQNGKQLYMVARPVHTYIYKDFVEQDAIEWKNILFDLFDELHTTTTILPEIGYISVTTSSSCILGIDNDFEPITKVMMVSDKRAHEQLQYILNLEIYKTLQQPCSISYALPKVLWQKNNFHHFDSVAYWLNAGDYITTLLSDEIFTDPLNASKYLYTENDGYPKALYEKLGIPITSLPVVKPIGYRVEVSAQIKNKYNLKNGCMFIQSTYDAICAVIGSGNGQEGNACDVSGTVTSVRMLINQTNHTVSSSSISTQNIDIIKKQIVGASNNLGGGLIEWVKQAFYADNEIDDAYHLMERDASKSGIGASGIIFLPYLLGERAPFSNPYIKGEFIGISRNVIKPDFTRAVFEATAYISRDLLSLIEQFNVRSLSVSGGLARFDSINQIKADVLNLPVYVLDNFESTSIGSLLLCLLTVEHDSYESLCNKLIKIRKIINPMQNNHTIYNDLYHFFVHCRNTMLPLYKEHYDIYRKLEGYAIKGIKNL